MTSRLKHKLELENVNLKSKYLNESFVQIGTPLPALGDHKKDKQEFLPAWQQDVRDEQGRRRFHGAFTGGWSAGYYNSVGSKEGWAPSTFKSSRSNRATKTQRPEDFMDDEDLAAMREDRDLVNTETFAPDAFAGTREELGDKSLSDALQSLVVPSKSSIGHTILQKLGWRTGQGIGPRVTLRKLQIQEGKLGRVRAGMEDDDDVTGEASKHTFAPRDTKLLVYAAKDDKGGLGYERGQGMGALPGKRPTWGTGEDEEDDLYGTGPSRDSLHYAFDIEEADDTIVLGQPGTASVKASGEPVASTSTDRWHDGRPVLSGFILDPKGVPQDKWFAFPDIPDDWRPRPARVWGTTRKFDEPAQSAEGTPTTRGAPGRPLTHEQRGAALGEEQRTSAAKSVFEFISEKDRERLAAFAAAAKANAPPPPPLSLEPEQEQRREPAPSTDIVIPPLSPRTASAALQGFMPFADDVEKQQRYRSYLSSQTYNTKTPNPRLLASTSVTEINRELESFAASARIFKPMALAMSSRFTSGSASLAVSDAHVPRPGLHIFDSSKAPVEFKPAHAELEVHKILSPREQAAADGNFGDLTRVVKDFYPTKLVCRRFHVADPHPEGPPEGKSGTATPTGTRGDDMLPVPKSDWSSGFVHQQGTDVENTPPPVPAEEEGERVPKSLAEVGMADDINQGREILTYTKPSIDIFKAIFASDDEDDDDEDDTEEQTKVVPVASKPKDPYPVDEKPVDYSTFKPVFRRTVEEPKDEKEGDEGKSKEKKKKKDKKKRKGVLSFAIEDGDEEAAPVLPKKKSKPQAPVEEEVWVEKAPVSHSAEGTGDEGASSARRKGAADYM